MGGVGFGRVYRRYGQTIPSSFQCFTVSIGAGGRFVPMVRVERDGMLQVLGTRKACQQEIMQIRAFWDILLCSLGVDRFRGAHFFHR
jgi:hypothetical protein